MIVRKDLIKSWVPPAIVAILSRMLGGTSFIGPYDTWSAALKASQGYEASAILDKVLKATLDVSQGKAAYERDSVLFETPDYVWPVLSGLLLAAARNNGRLDVLDFGGSLGSSYFQHRLFLSSLPSLHWNVVEQLHFVEAGQTSLNEPGLRFYPNIDSCLKENDPNIVLLSSVIQYLEDPYTVLQEILATDASFLLIDRTPLIEDDIDRILVQKVSPRVYEASYPMWALSRKKLLSGLAPNWSLQATTPAPEGKQPVRGMGNIQFEGLIFIRIK